MDEFPPLLDPAGLPRRALVVAPHPDDEVLGCGGLAAFHAERGDALRVLVLTDGAGALEGEERTQLAQGRERESRAAGAALGVEDLRFAAFSGRRVAAAPQRAQGRERESRAAGAALGVEDLRFAGFSDGRLGAAPELVERLRAELDDFAPELVYAPSAFEHHRDHLATLTALAAALERGPRRRVLLYGVNSPVPGGLLVDTTRWRERKESALRAFESQGGAELARKGGAADLARTLDVDVPGVESAEAFVEVPSDGLRAHLAAARAVRAAAPDAGRERSGATAVISTWNKVDDLRANLDGIRAQTRPFDAVVVVDNASSDGTAEAVVAEFPEVRVIRMPHSAYGACETFNIGFASAVTPLIAILDDDVVLPPEWLEKTLARLEREPPTTAVVSTEVVEPGMPESYIDSPQMRRERYMSTFRGCASLARAEALRQAGFYDERLFIYGNERDLTCRLLNLGYRVLQYPEVRTFHRTPFGIKMGKRSLYYHARNAWLTMLKYAPAADLARLPWLVVTRVLLRRGEKESTGEVSDATGTIGIGRSVRETPGAWWVLLKAGASVVRNLPYCLRHRAPVQAEDFELPLK